MRKPIPFHVLCFAVFPVLALYVPNAGYTPLSDLFAPIVVLLAATIIVCGALSLVMRDLQKVCLIVSLGLFLFFTYGWACRLLDSVSIMGLRVFRARYIVILDAIVFGLIVWPILRTTASLRHVTRVLNILSITVVLTPTISIGYLLANQQRAAGVVLAEEILDADDLEMPARPPDIYYLILDGYGRSDVLEEYHGVNNSDLTNELRRMGFYVADQSTANYVKTVHSLASSLNLLYLAEVAERAGIKAEPKGGFKILAELLKHNQVMQTLRQLGYTVTTFASGWGATERILTDDYRSPSIDFTEFETGLLALTPVPAILRKLQLMTPLRAHRRRVLYVLDTLPELSKEHSPKFVFAHILCPHYPYTFDEDGGFQDHEPEDYCWNENQRPTGYNAAEYRELTLDGYGPQVRFLTRRITETIAQILQRSSHPPIIILQGDHGPDSLCHPTEPDLACLHEKFPILNAYYLPNEGDKMLYPDITPVNTFRVIFNHYFGANFELLPDRNYWSTYFRPLRFEDVTDQVQMSRLQSSHLSGQRVEE